ncbi:YceI family protein [Hyphobacterium sp.]|uniref:YceI family protein n=1 Tax=Hyphobacterium sp. TaxID=2004662 RepID=UPI003BABB672
MNKPFLAICLTVTAATPVLAQDVYDIDSSHTQATFSVDRFGFTTIFGSFGTSGGTITLDAEAPENSSVSAFVETGSVMAGDPVRDEHLAGPFWLNAPENAQLTFESTSVALTGENTADVTGQLTLWGEAREVTFNAVLNQMATDPSNQRPAVGFTITGTINRTDWGHEIASQLVGTEIGIRIETLAHLRAEEE